MRWILAGGLVGLAAVLIGLAAALSSSSPTTRGTFAYATSTPQETLESVWLMVERREVHRLPELVHAESPEMRSVFVRVGRLLGNLQTLAEEVGKRHPDEVAALRAQMEERIGRGGSINLGRGGGGSPAVRALLADPFGWAESARGRVAALQTADNIAAVMVDGKPALGVGVVMRREEGGWRFVLPTNLPGVSRYMPKTRDEFLIVASMVRVIDNAVVELASDVRSGECGSIEGVAELAGEKMWMPMAMCVVAYTKAMEARGKGRGPEDAQPARESRPRTEVRIGL